MRRAASALESLSRGLDSGPRRSRVGPSVTEALLHLAYLHDVITREVLRLLDRDAAGPPGVRP